MKHNIAFATLACWMVIPSMAQWNGLTCRNNDPVMLQERIGNDPDRAAEIQQAEDQLEAFTQQYAADHSGERGGSQYIIPVVFHIIHDDGVENISDAQVHDAIRVLNEDFQKLNADTGQVEPAFMGIAADCDIEFRLAQLDPQGNCTRGINRVRSALTYSGDQDMKDLIQWPRNMYLNVWTCADAGGAAGYTFNPGSVSSFWASDMDGIVMLHNYTGSIGTSQPSRSRTLTHEVGHWINLRHTWGGTNEPGLTSNCGSDDNVSDTPNTIGWTVCNLQGQSCGSLDNVENYMEYSYCSKMFTEGQLTRMHASLISSTAQRNQLWTNSNLVATGTTGADILCAADVSASIRTICAGGSLQLFDESYHGVTQWDWTINGATPSNTQDENPWITFANPGIYDVSLTAGNGNSTVSTTKQGFITVLASSGLPDPYAEGFESTTILPNTDWTVVNADGAATFDVFNSAGYTGSQCVRMSNYWSSVGETDELISNTIDVSNAVDVTLTFRYAFARRNGSNDDALRLYVSKDCGLTWNLRDQWRGQNDLPTVSDMSGVFVPTSQSQWGYAEVDNISTSYHVSDFRFKFWFQGDGGNNLYIDDINLNGQPVGIDEFVLGSADDLVVFPNPTIGNAEVLLDLQEGGASSLQVMDVTGRMVLQQDLGQLNAGEHRLPLRSAALGAGSYLLRVTQGVRSRTVRFVVK